jgi:hypothetical protein
MSRTPSWQDFFLEPIIDSYDERVGLLGRVKVRSLNADDLHLACYHVLVYAQLEGFVKDVVGQLVDYLNKKKSPRMALTAEILRDRTEAAEDELRALLSLDTYADIEDRVRTFMQSSCEIKPLQTKYELNQMNGDTIEKVYRWFGWSTASVSVQILTANDLITVRNSVAHHGRLTKLGTQSSRNELMRSIIAVSLIMGDIGEHALNYILKE